MISFSNFGSNTHASALKVKRAVALVQGGEPGSPDRRRDAGRLRRRARRCSRRSIRGRASSSPNVLIFPDLESANAAYKLVWRLAGAEAIGPILLGLKRPVHVLQRGVDVADIVNMAAIAVVDAQERSASHPGPPV